MHTTASILAGALALALALVATEPAQADHRRHGFDGHHRHETGDDRAHRREARKHREGHRRHHDRDDDDDRRHHGWDRGRHHGWHHDHHRGHQYGKYHRKHHEKHWKHPGKQYRKHHESYHDRRYHGRVNGHYYVSTPWRIQLFDRRHRLRATIPLGRNADWKIRNGRIYVYGRHHVRVYGGPRFHLLSSHVRNHRHRYDDGLRFSLRF